MNKIKRTAKEFIPRHNYITTTAHRTVGKPSKIDEHSNISEYQIVLNVGPHVTDLVPGDIIRFEKTAFPSNIVYETKEASEGTRVYAIPVRKDDFGIEFIWMSDRAIMFKFEKD
jgi:hypothetical protein